LFFRYLKSSPFVRMKFIKLSNLVINSSKISSIQMYNNKYYINVVHGAFGGVQFGIAGTGFGNVSSNCDRFEICKEKDKEDYMKVTQWIDEECKK
jgi:hypothetical protein